MLSFDTNWPADAVEFCPFPGSTDLVVCGTYKLLETPGEKQQRKGQCILLKVDKQENRIHSLQSLSFPAVLDLKWESWMSDPNFLILAVADSEGHITMCRLDHQDYKALLTPIQTISCGSTDVLCLSLDWSDRKDDGFVSTGALVASSSDGHLSLLKDNGSDIQLTMSWHAHDYEPWVAAWDYWDPNTVYSGGDDLILKSWDVRTSCDTPTATNKRFEGGVTSIQSNPHSEFYIAVGSYDSNVRLLDKRKLGRPVSTVEVGGGAWQVKWHPSSTRQHDLLVACMHDGCKVVRFGGFGDQEEPQIVKRFDEHQSMAYGVDWAFSSPRTDEKTEIVSCSFYDHALRVWEG
ncbi:WD40 repeat-like protein [Sistotremastrum suecicum HHB10207 ss-3]|uniref:methylated diphthine methylhydrolase n=1 Tax=Sistotremastrum suecicum HHB10207 ss-3 TaxID=1314776 RepID=A0A166J4P5_9AGAM|nr:WD40 repeat-like protein [Sistotremastrum suecicum HHB10207 ss-3]